MWMTKDAMGINNVFFREMVEGEKNLRKNLEEYLCLRERRCGGGFQEIEK